MPKLRVHRHEVVQPLDDSYRLVPLTQGQTSVVDAEDYGWLSEFNWRAKKEKSSGKFYASRHLPGNRTSPMHSEIIGCMADHISRDTLDNRRQNLRPATTSENGRNRAKQSNNTSGFIGVCRYGDKWGARIWNKGKLIHLGIFSTPEAAALARDAAVKREYGEFGVLNFH